MLTFSLDCHLDDSALHEGRLFHFPQDPHRDSTLIRNHLRNFFASNVRLKPVHEARLPWQRAMLAGLRNCHVDELTLSDNEYPGHRPLIMQQIVGE